MVFINYLGARFFPSYSGSYGFFNYLGAPLGRRSFGTVGLVFFPAFLPSFFCKESDKILTEFLSDLTKF